MVETDRWLYEMRHQDEFRNGIDAEDITVDEWFKFWHVEEQKKFLEAAKRSHNYYHGSRVEDGQDDRFDVGKLLGHSSLKMTMDRYVHVTDDSMEMGIRLFEQGQLENGLATAE